MDIWEKLGLKPKMPPQEIVENLERQMEELRNRIAAEQAAVSGLPDNMKNIKIERLKQELAGLEIKRNLAWEKARREDEKRGEPNQ